MFPPLSLSPFLRQIKNSTVYSHSHLQRCPSSQPVH
jgi:hypothetical protein